jgi:hypothetical protein
MFRKSWIVSVVAFVLAAWLPGTLVAETVSVPFGTRVFIELDQKVTSKKKHNRPGSFVTAHVWRDVVVNGRTVVKAGTPAMVQIGHIKPAKVAGIKGHVELVALHVTAVDGGDLMLTGGYDQSGKSLTALSVTLAVVIFVPLIFLKGKQAKLQPGTVFDAMVSQPTEIKIDDSKPVKIRLARTKPLTVTIPYKQLEGADAQKEMKDLPLRITVEGDMIQGPRVVKVNDVAIEPIPIVVGQARSEEEGYLTADATVNLKALGKHFTQGFNNFTVDVGGRTDDVMLDLEL